MLNVAEGGVGGGRGEGRALIQGTSAQDERSGLDPVAWGPLIQLPVPTSTWYFPISKTLTSIRLTQYH